MTLSTKILLPLAALLTRSDATASTASSNASPIPKVITMLDNLLSKIENQGKAEQASYDKFACWCETTVAQTASDISKAKQSIEDLTNKITELKGSMGSLESSIKQLNADIGENVQATKESEAVRGNEHDNYATERAEAEQCIGALKAAIKVLSSGRKFLQNGAHAYTAQQETQLMSVAADVQGVLHKQAASHLLSQEDLKVVRAFVSNPAGEMSAVQVGQSQNPFGDYAPQSDQIVGILKALLDSFSANLDKGKDDEGREEKSFEELMATKKQELKTLQISVQKQEYEFAEKKKTLADSKEQLDDTKADLQSEESLFEDTESTCKKRSAEWSQRTQLRTMEINGIQKAKEILNSKKSKEAQPEAFKGAAASLVQVSRLQHRSVQAHRAGSSSTFRRKAYDQLRSVAAEQGNLDAARVAEAVKSGGSGFEKVLMMIDRMVEDLRLEEKEDIEHRDRCERSQNSNGNEKEDLAHTEATLKETITRMENTKKAKETELSENRKQSKEIQKEMDDRLKLRNEEHDDFKKALEADTTMIEIITKAQEALREFYKSGGKEAASFVEDASSHEGEKPPKVAWGDEGGNYGGEDGQHQGAMAALAMIKEDLQKEIKVGRAEEAENQQKYEEDVATMEKALKSKKDTIQAIQQQLADLGVHIEDNEATLSQTQEDAKEAKDMTKALDTDCKWVKTHFDSRRKKRKAEIQGLQEAKGHIAKANAGDEDDELDLDNA